MDGIAEPHGVGAAAKLSRRLWGLDWRDHLPWHLDEIDVEVGSTEEVLAFAQENYADIFNQNPEHSRFFIEPMTEAKKVFCDEMDLFAFRHDSRIVGIAMAHPTDWSTYYGRSGAYLPAYQGRRLFGRWVELTFGPLRAAGAARFDVDTAPSNVACIRMLTRLGYDATGMVNTDRWGALVRFTKFLQEGPERVFQTQFCGGASPRRPSAPERGDKERRTP